MRRIRADVKRAVRASALPLLLALLLSSCVRKPAVLPANVQTGTASWYGEEFHGRLTSNREVYDMYDLTAAHKSLPFGTLVMVTNLLNGKSVQVRINDRGPFIGDRLIDLSYAAARLLDMVGPGTAPVRLEILGSAPSVSPAQEFSRFWVQVGAFALKDNADNLLRRLVAIQGCEGALLSEYRTPAQVFYRVRIPVPSQPEAQAVAQKLADAGFQVIILEE